MTNTGISQISECEAEKIQVSLAMNTKCLDSNHSGSPQQDDNEVNPYCDNPSYDILYRPRPLVYEKQCNIYKASLNETCSIIQKSSEKKHIRKC